METKHTPGPWRTEKTAGWGGGICIVADGHTKPIFKAVKPDAYYTDFPPGREPGSVVISSRLAAAQGRYVATPEVRAEIDAVEEANARLMAAAPELLEALQRMVANHIPLTGNPSHERLVEHWEDEKSQGNGEAEDMLFVMAAIAKATGAAA